MSLQGVHTKEGFKQRSSTERSSGCKTTSKYHGTKTNPGYINSECTTPELYTTRSKPILRCSYTNDFLQNISVIPTSPSYATHIKELKKDGRMINVTTADGNCLYRSLCKGLIGTEQLHYSVRSVLFGFIYMNSTIFMPHIRQKHPGVSSINEYCSAMSKDGVWGTDIEILAASTLLQVPIYTFHPIIQNFIGGSGTYPYRLQVMFYVIMSSQ